MNVAEMEHHFEIYKENVKSTLENFYRQDMDEMILKLFNQLIQDSGAFDIDELLKALEKVSFDVFKTFSLGWMDRLFMEWLSSSYIL